jgi:hypothetical protein
LKEALTLSNESNCVETFPFLYLMMETDPVSEILFQKTKYDECPKE